MSSDFLPAYPEARMKTMMVCLLALHGLGAACTCINLSNVVERRQQAGKTIQGVVESLAVDPDDGYTLLTIQVLKDLSTNPEPDLKTMVIRTLSPLNSC